MIEDILDNTEGFEPIPSNIFKRNVLSGEFVRINRYLVRDLMARGLWNEALKDRIVAAEGSVQDVPGIPDDLKELYRTVWEISQRHIIDLAADRGAFVCQSQSMNIYLRGASLAKLTSMHFYGWQKGLKTGSYYIRQMAARGAQMVTVEAVAAKAPAAAVAATEGEPKADEAAPETRAIEAIDPTTIIKAKQVLIDKGTAQGEQDFAGLTAAEIVAWATGVCQSGDASEGCIMCSG